MMEICIFSTFTYVRQICFAYNFFVNFFKNFLTDWKSAWNSAFFIPFQFYQKKILYGILVLFSNIEAKRAKNGAKNQKTFFVNVS